LCRFLGDISYLIYITHYPLIYTCTALQSVLARVLAPSAGLSGDGGNEHFRLMANAGVFRNGVVRQINSTSKKVYCLNKIILCS
jgi:hypothetical protein